MLRWREGMNANVNLNLNANLNANFFGPRRFAGG